LRYRGRPKEDDPEEEDPGEDRGEKEEEMTQRPRPKFPRISVQ